jgi:hypothetical protein
MYGHEDGDQRRGHGREYPVARQSKMMLAAA